MKGIPLTLTLGLPRECKQKNPKCNPYTFIHFLAFAFTILNILKSYENYYTPSGSLQGSVKVY
jgi:hypothetical protein